MATTPMLAIIGIYFLQEVVSSSSATRNCATPEYACLLF